MPKTEDGGFKIDDSTYLEDADYSNVHPKKTEPTDDGEAPASDAPKK